MCDEGRQIRELFLQIICERDFPVTLFNGVRFSQSALANSYANALISHDIRVTTALETHLYFHAMNLMSR